MPVKSAKSKKKKLKKIKKVIAPPVEESPETNQTTPETTSEPPKIASFSQLDTKLNQTTGEDPLTEPETTQPKHSTIGPVDIPPISEDEPEQEEAKEPSITEPSSSEDIKEWLKDIRPDTTKEIEKKGGFSFKLFFIFIIMFALIGALIGGMFYYANSVSMKPETKQEETNNVTPSPTEPSPSPTPEVKVDLSKLKVSVLNGSGVSGEAAKVRTLLTEKGFTAQNIRAGNASASNFTTTTVSLKASVPEQVYKEVESALSAQYTVAKSDKPLADTSANDVEVIVGTKK